jgi:uncharacterized protein
MKCTHLDTIKLAQIAMRATDTPLLVSVSGAHLYGFASPDSDVDLRGTHLLPLSDLIGLDPPRSTLDRSWVEDGLEIDLVSHELAKFLLLLLRQNGNYLEQLYSPLVIIESNCIEELRSLVRGARLPAMSTMPMQAMPRTNGASGATLPSMDLRRLNCCSTPTGSA